MTREEARKAAEVMMAYAECKDIEFSFDNGEVWRLCSGDDADQLGFDFNRCNYRIKKEPTYRPFKDKEECWQEMQKHQPLGWLYHDSRFINIANIYNKGIVYLYGEDFDSLDYTGSFEYLKFADGTPFGVKE